MPLRSKNSFARSIERQRRHRHCPRIAASNGEPDDDNDDDDASSSFDIDALASALSRAAEERRRRADEGGGNVGGDDFGVNPLDSTSTTPPPPPTSSFFSSLSPFGADAKRREEEVLDELGGDGGFEPDEIELVSLLCFSSAFVFFDLDDN